MPARSTSPAPPLPTVRVRPLRRRPDPSLTVPQMLFALTKYGIAKVANMPDYQSAMPVYEGTLSDADIVAALSWIKSQWPAEIRAQHDELNQRARKS